MPTQVRVPDFDGKKRRGEKIVILTAYDATMASLFDQSGIDALLVGDSLGTVILGCENTLQVTLEAVVHHTRAVISGARRALVVADMPFLTFQVSVSGAVRNAGRLIQEGGAAAVKIEGGRPSLPVVKRLVDIGIPVMGHLGLQPQSVHQVGGYRRRATNPAGVEALLTDAMALQEAGAFAVVLEAIPPDVARSVTQHLVIPTIGIAAGPHCDGQILVSYDMLGLSTDAAPPFVQPYARIADTIRSATEAYAADVRAGRFGTPAAAAVAVATSN